MIILISPFVLMAGVNEYVRTGIKSNAYFIKNITAINTGEKLKNKCTWHCHDNTSFCKKNHVNSNGIFFKIIDPIYFGIIDLLKSTGHYMLANIIFLVILFPLVIYFLLIKNIELRIKINKIKNA
ncbi:MAG: hypothetical protein AAFZ15_10140 [Bacteroidota bacterium]